MTPLNKKLFLWECVVSFFEKNSPLRKKTNCNVYYFGLNVEKFSNHSSSIHSEKLKMSSRDLVFVKVKF